MFLGPYEQGGDFRDRGIAGTRRFLAHLWASVTTSATAGTADAEVMRELHRTIQKVSDDIPRLSYNTAIAAMMKYMNVVRSGDRIAHRDEVGPLVQLVAPFAPHIAEELWERLGHRTSVFASQWPSFDADRVADELVTVAVQVNGKLRGTVRVSPAAAQADVYAVALSDPAVSKHITGSARKIVYVPGRLLNVVV